VKKLLTRRDQTGKPTPTRAGTMRVTMKAVFVTAFAAAFGVLTPTVAQAATTWSVSSSYGISEVSMSSSGYLSIGATSKDTKCDSKSHGLIGNVVVGGDTKKSFYVPNYGGCNTWLTKWFFYDISEIGGTSGYVSIRSCRVQKIFGVENFYPCSSLSSRTFTIT
jgi:hypothetical protein